MSEMNFEKAVARLEDIVAKLESGDCPLDKTVELYDEGLKIAELCKKQLGEAKQRVVSLEEYRKEISANED